MQLLLAYFTSLKGKNKAYEITTLCVCVCVCDLSAFVKMD